MTNSTQAASIPFFNRRLWRTNLAMALVFAGVLVTVQSAANGQTFTVLHNFTGGADGANPYAGLTFDGRSNLYGTTFGAGNGGGTVFRVSRRSGGWTFTPLYKFAGGNDGSNPYAGVAIGLDGTLYGTTAHGGDHGQGTVFNLKPPPHISPNLLAPWVETVFYSFKGGSDGAVPYGGVNFDQAGDIYGTTTTGGVNCYPMGCGTVYELMHSGSGWTESVIHAFSGTRGDGQVPQSGMISDGTGNLYGTTLDGGDYGYGLVYELTYTAGSGWSESFLYSGFSRDGLSNPVAGVIFDPSGNLYGATPIGPDGGGAFELTPSNGSWTYSVLYQFGGGGTSCGPRANLVMDGTGDLYGTTYCDGAHSQGSVFKLTHVNGGWTSSSLYSFTGGADGQYPISNVVIDANGNLYGTTQSGGAYGYGVVWEITP